ncbi:hypothetical protein GCM10012319_36830 [Comamonas sp. KCTC 72670]|nr:hypothetical protein GCM10012319_36830 [Comamonas sp. KCTC 72670]
MGRVCAASARCVLKVPPGALAGCVVRPVRVAAARSVLKVPQYALAGCVMRPARVASARCVLKVPPRRTGRMRHAVRIRALGTLCIGKAARSRPREWLEP